MTGRILSIQYAMSYVYILLLNTKKLYTGYTKNLKRRMSEHTQGKVASTMHQRPLILICYEAYLLDSDARRRERYLKTTEGKRMLKYQLRDILQQYNILPHTERYPRG